MSRKADAASKKLADAAPLFAALGDATRLGLVSRLCSDGPLSIARLCEGSDITRQAIAKHLLALSDSGVVRGRRVGRENIYELEPRRLARAQRFLDEISQRWDDALGRLQAFVETDET